MHTQQLSMGQQVVDVPVQSLALSLVAEHPCPQAA